MAITVEDANTYISANCIDIDDWNDAGEAKQLRIVNVASRDLAQFYPSYTIPDAAVYEFANVLATVYGDSVRLAQQGVSGFSLSGVASFNYKDSAINIPGGSTRKYIPQTALDIIGAENGVTLSKRGVMWSVM
ncbi:hypothetical protein [Paenibacillus sp. YN15]|uniref:hypothetical protein n=1 Tax=Paenibacillus sp. YN15 TaxID=1742774 RepID=UPI000DCE59BD|nr:hypothetical protein [Paenibacillus sp. YN15]RAU96836.1 hypothetical protein DQG13_19985 [Paenibacillus sp. YN15]